MKKLTLILLIIISPLFWRGVGGEAFAQTTDSTKKQLGLVVKTDILLPAITLAKSRTAEFSLTVEKLIKKRHSIQLTFIYFNNYIRTRSYIIPPSGIEIDKTTTNSIAIIPEYKFFVSKKKNHTGYYIGISAAYGLQLYRETYTANIPAGVSYYNGVGPATLSNYRKDNDQFYAFGIINGFQYYLYKCLVLDFVAGAGNAADFNQSFRASSQFVWRLGLNIGYKF